MAQSNGRLLLHTSAGNKNAAKSLIAAEYVGVKIEITPSFQFGVSNKTPEFLKLNPLGKVPVLETPDGAIFESNAIARYVARLKSNALFGSSAIDAAHVEQWIDFATTEIDANIFRWLGPIRGRVPFSAEVQKFAIEAVQRALAALNTHLSTQTYMVGHFVTLADVVLMSNLSLGYQNLFTEEFTRPYLHVDRYFWTLINLPHFKKHLGEVVRVEKLAVPPTGDTPTKKEKAHPAKKEKPKESSKPKEEVSKPKEITPADTSFDDEEEAAPKPKAKNPLDFLPPSPMVLDSWKRLYSNTKAKDFREVAIKGFWEMYDPEGYSLWFCYYKYNDENTVPFVTMNKVSGFLQRMDFIRKYAFGKVCILGESAPYKIKGVWLFRGPEIPQQVKDECYDIELYDWHKVDITDEVQKERVSAYFEEPDDIEGEKLLEAKCFK
ncbi:hypothetical protein O6H91_08G094500 [Diphasiastrum complanatum]|uniref:Uncharacterized protein n=1 Tax=Diphasiastrum complanatum TaxID=34168 RepID=A0ACC2CZZ4_DIPCM|nr:hypothetical protein O6H91_08G094500 [Diphasiastrum complanatum]